MRNQLPSGQVFTATDLLGQGWTRDAIRHAIACGRIHRLRRGVFGRQLGEREAAIAAALSNAGSVVSHRSAAVVHGLPIVGRRPTGPELTVPPSAPVHASDVHMYRAALRPEDIATIADIRVTSPARTIVDVARHCPVTTAVVAADVALHTGVATPEQIDDVLRFCATWPRIAHAQRAIRLVDPRAESPLESISRLVMYRLHLPAPETQQVIIDRHGRPIARCDFYWDEFGVVGEADGQSKYDDPDRLRIFTDEKERQEQLEDLGLVVVRWGWTQAWYQPRTLGSRIEHAFERGRLRDRSGFNREWGLPLAASTHSA